MTKERGKVILPGGIEEHPGILLRDPDTASRALDAYLRVARAIHRNAASGKRVLDEKTYEKDVKYAGEIQEGLFSTLPKKKKQEIRQLGIHYLRWTSELYGAGEGLAAQWAREDGEPLD